MGIDAFTHGVPCESGTPRLTTHLRRGLEGPATVGFAACVGGSGCVRKVVARCAFWCTSQILTHHFSTPKPFHMRITYITSLTSKKSASRDRFFLFCFFHETLEQPGASRPFIASRTRISRIRRATTPSTRSIYTRNASCRALILGIQRAGVSRTAPSTRADLVSGPNTTSSSHKPSCTPTKHTSSPPQPTPTRALTHSGLIIQRLTCSESAY
jgi:hypothetical protein